jgi:hypothetical protein
MTVHISNATATQVSSTAQKAINAFWATPAGGLILKGLSIAGVVVIISVLFIVLKRLVSGNKTSTIGPLVLAVVVGGICFDPQLITQVLAASASVLGELLKSTTSVASRSSAPTP